MRIDWLQGKAEMIRKRLRLYQLLIMILVGLNASLAQAGIALGQTRLVYPQGASSQSITMRNTEATFYLVEAAVTDWVTNKPVPAFSVLPPLFRLEGNGENVIRVVRTGGDLPQDRESVFHFRVNAIPGRPEEVRAPSENGTQLAISLGMGIKLFYRPDGLKMKPDEAYRSITVTREEHDVVVKNPTPYYLTFSTLLLGNEKVEMEGDASMLAPFSESRYASHGRKGEQATWSFINDFGGVTDDYHVRIQ